jgi:hypothetical protein
MPGRQASNRQFVHATSSPMRTLFWITAGTTALIFRLSLWPGFWPDLLSSCLLIVLIAPWMVIVIISAGLGILDTIETVPQSFERRKWRRRTFALTMVTLVLVSFDVPKRIAFACHVTAFEKLRTSIGDEELHDPNTHETIGLYTVQELASDGKGAVYFCTGDGSGPGLFEHRYHGFAYRPNDHVTPWGGDRYRLQHLFGNWYSYTVSID